jgi:hypothetical protein
VEATRSTDRELSNCAGSDRAFRVGDECFILASATAPRFSHLTGEITGGLELRDYYDDFGEIQGARLAYKVRVRGEEVCAPPGMLVKR